MKAVVLIDNITNNELTCEWGLSIYITHNGHTILLDTGASGSFADNAKAMGLDLSKVEYGILSHAHYDHSDGMEIFFAINKTAPFVLRSSADENCYKDTDEGWKYIGIKKGVLSEYKDRIVYAKGLYQLYPGAWLLPHSTPGLDAIGKKMHMYVRADGVYRPDEFAHEQSLVLETESGLAVFSSCSHGGADNIIREVREAFPGKKIRTLIGGLHLFSSPLSETEALGGKLKELGVSPVITGHCTGDEPYALLKSILGDGVQQTYTGLTVEL